MKICIITSTGGHLTQVLSVLDAFGSNDNILIIHDFPSVKKSDFPEFKKQYRLKVLFNYSLPVRFLSKKPLWLGCYITLLYNLFEIIYIFLKERPDIIFSTGAEIAVPAFYLGKFLFGARLIFLESITRIKDLSGTGKTVIPITDLFLVQWQEIEERYKNKVSYKGRLI